MNNLIRKAKRSKSFLKIGLESPSGGGKTYSALLLAKGLNGGSLENVCIIDTENCSADLYSHLGDYSVFPFDPPYAPSRYSNAIEIAIAEGFKTIIIDSISHEWEGAGGALEIHQKFGGQFNDWKKVTPLHRAFIDSILQAKAHIITTSRKKVEYVVELNSKGKNAPRKVGTKSVQREGFEYELSCNLDIDTNHMAVASKDRTGLFSDPVPFLITEETGQLLKKWSEGE